LLRETETPLYGCGDGIVKPFPKIPHNKKLWFFQELQIGLIALSEVYWIPAALLK
jgi:hypothetical protein